MIDKVWFLFERSHAKADLSRSLLEWEHTFDNMKEHADSEGVQYLQQ